MSYEKNAKVIEFFKKYCDINHLYVVPGLDFISKRQIDRNNEVKSFKLNRVAQVTQQAVMKWKILKLDIIVIWAICMDRLLGKTYSKLKLKSLRKV